MAFLADVIAFAREVINGVSVPVTTVDRGSGRNSTAGHFGPAGDDSPPLPDDVSVCVEGAAGSGSTTAVGYQDPKNAGKALPGERLLYARNPQGGVVLEVYLKRDGSFLVESKTGAPLELKTTGAVIVDASEIKLGRTAGTGVAYEGATVTGTGMLDPITGMVDFVGVIVGGSNVTKTEL
jgi:hypothetical protein